jgi:hypothetical protein
VCFRSKIKLVVPAILVAGTLGGCSSDIYLDRREGQSLASGDAQATNRVAHMIDPWPKASANTNIAYNGSKMQTAVERYRTGRVIRPISATTSSAAYSQTLQPAQPLPPSDPAPIPIGGMK